MNVLMIVHNCSTQVQSSGSTCPSSLKWHAWFARCCLGRRLSTWQMTAASCPTAVGTLCSQLTYRLACCREHLAVTATELFQLRDFACGTLLWSSCAIQTLPTDCSDDSWRDTLSGSMNTALRDFWYAGPIEQHHLLTYNAAQNSSVTLPDMSSLLRWSMRGVQERGTLHVFHTQQSSSKLPVEFLVSMCSLWSYCRKLVWWRYVFTGARNHRYFIGYLFFLLGMISWCLYGSYICKFSSFTFSVLSHWRFVHAV